jgi:F-type H+-transporting ATPase subunit epsilon
MSNLNLEIIAPSGVLFKGECHMAVVPSVDGDIGIMHGHEAVIAALRAGTVDIYDEKQNLIKSFEVISGFAEMESLSHLVVLLNS